MTIIKNGCICGKDYYTTTEQCDDVDCKSERSEDNEIKMIPNTIKEKITHIVNYNLDENFELEKELWYLADTIQKVMIGRILKFGKINQEELNEIGKQLI